MNAEEFHWKKFIPKDKGFPNWTNDEVFIFAKAYHKEQLKDVSDNALTLIQTLANATGAEFEDEGMALEIISNHVLKESDRYHKEQTEEDKSLEILTLVASQEYKEELFIYKKHQMIKDILTPKQ